MITRLHPDERSRRTANHRLHHDPVRLVGRVQHPVVVGLAELGPQQLIEVRELATVPRLEQPALAGGAVGDLESCELRFVPARAQIAHLPLGQAELCHHLLVRIRFYLRSASRELAGQLLGRFGRRLDELEREPLDDRAHQLHLGREHLARECLVLERRPERFEFGSRVAERGGCRRRGVRFDTARIARERERQRARQHDSDRSQQARTRHTRPRPATCQCWGTGRRLTRIAIPIPPPSRSAPRTC